MMRSGARGGDVEEEEDRKPVIKPGVHVTLKVQDAEDAEPVKALLLWSQMQKVKGIVLIRLQKEKHLM